MMLRDVHRHAILGLLFARWLSADAGILIPADKTEPDPQRLALAEMEIDARVDNQVARVRVKQIFENRTAGVLEGKYVFALPARALVSDFAVWDDVVRIPGVILERRRAQEIYEQLRWQSIDPGLLQMGERDSDEARRGAVFSARIVPIPGHGTKRLEMEYHETVPVELLQSLFAVPLRPEAYRVQRAAKFRIQLELITRHPIQDFQNVGAAYALKIDERTANRVRASFTGTNVNLSEDFAVKWSLAGGKDRLEVLTHRDAGEPGFFQASLLTAPVSVTAQPRTVIALFDTSLSMQWEKLDKSFRALETMLRGLTANDKFSLILFNDEAKAVQTAPVAATPAAVDAALEAVRASRLRGGTNVQAALEAALKQTSGANTYVVLIGDGGSTRGIVHNSKLAAWYADRWKQLPVASRPSSYVFGIGDDANLPLLKMLARQNGVFEWVRSTEPVEFKLNAFLSKIGRRPIEGLSLKAEPTANFDMIYRLDEAVFSGSVGAWVGQYKSAGAATFQLGTQQASVSLPAQEAAAEHLPRTWAKARVDALLEKIDRDGEDAATIDEIIALSRKYKFVTPYTSFLAAPRSLLRPRLIRPGDPVLRVRTDESIVSVVAMFPFGLVKPLRFLKDENIWQTRFLAPSDMTDGTYQVNMILRDREGRVYREQKSFVIASKPPVVKVNLDRAQYHRGETVKLRVSASATSRTIVARMQGATPAYLRWNAEMKSNTGQLVIPSHLPAGRYKLMVNAEDFAHNIGTQEVNLDVLP
ncbi:MAG: VWA domain-containing protein [Acidobacteria bacterium]|nr:VWA domain-containing protein [Acidobacteriota bacterium]